MERTVDRKQRLENVLRNVKVETIILFYYESKDLN